MSDLPTNNTESSADDIAFVRNLIEIRYDRFREILLPLLHYDEDDVSDCINMVVEAAYQNAHMLRTCKNPSGWLYRTMQYRVKRVLQKRSKQPVILSLDDVNIRAAHEQVYEDTYEDVSTDENAIEEAKQKCISVLTQKEKEIYNLFYEQHLTIAEIHTKTGYSVSSVKVVLHRLRTKLLKAANNFF